MDESASRPSASTPTPHGVPVDARLRSAERLWAIGDITGIWPLTHVGKYQGEVVATNILGEPREANYDAVPRVVFTDPQAASVGSTDGRFSATVAPPRRREDRDVHPRLRREQRVPDPASATASCSPAPTRSGPRPASGSSRRRSRFAHASALEVLRDTIQPFPTFSEIYIAALKALHAHITEHSTS